MDFSIRPMHLEDVPQVTEIEREAFPETWPPTPFKKELQNKLARYLVAWTRWDEPAADPPQSEARPVLEKPQLWVQRMLASVRDLVAAPPEVVHQQMDFISGYVGMWFMVDEAHITSIATRGAYRRLGLGELLMQGAVELAMAQGMQRITLEARVSNFPAHALYEKYGFQKVGTRKRYYADNHEDAVIMTADSILSPSYKDLFQRCVDAFSQRRGETIRLLA